jgi:hypothetical protein
MNHGSQVMLDPLRDEFVIGRARPPRTDVRLLAPSVSREHALLRRIPTGIEVIDRASTNGIRLPRIGALRAERLTVGVGDRFCLGEAELLALDDMTYGLMPSLRRHLPGQTHDGIDHAFEAVIHGYVMAIYSEDADNYLEFARALHANSIRREYPFVHLTQAPEAGEELCLASRGGTVFLDMSRPFHVPHNVAQSLFLGALDLWTIIMTSLPAEGLLLHLGSALGEPKPAGFRLRMFGFPGEEWRASHGTLRW